MFTDELHVFTESEQDVSRKQARLWGGSQEAKKGKHLVFSWVLMRLTF